MPQEIERRFLLKEVPKEAIEYSDIIQGYLSTDSERTIRIRIEDGIENRLAFITIKTKVEGASFARNEFEYPIPIKNARELMTACFNPIIKKTRYTFGRWEIDKFHDDFNGLIIAEIELDSEDEQIELPEWASNEITGIRKYSNAGLVEGWSNENNSGVCW